MVVAEADGGSVVVAAVGVDFVVAGVDTVVGIGAAAGVDTTHTIDRDRWFQERA